MDMFLGLFTVFLGDATGVVSADTAVLISEQSGRVRDRVLVSMGVAAITTAESGASLNDELRPLYVAAGAGTCVSSFNAAAAATAAALCLGELIILMLTGRDPIPELVLANRAPNRLFFGVDITLCRGESGGRWTGADI